MNTPRADHVLFSPDGKTLVAAGGHTTGFIPVSTAEYFDGGKWHSIQTVYQHDAPFLVEQKNGNFIIGGGYSNYLGVGQSIVMEEFRPAEESFSPMKILDRKRARSSAIELSGGKILISGNWFAEDLTEIWSQDNGTESSVKPSQDRSDPYILKTGPDDAIIFAPSYNFDELRPIIIDRLSGGSFTEPLFDTLRPLPLAFDSRGRNFAGNEANGDYSYLIAAQSTSDQTAIIRFDGDAFSVLDMQFPVPGNGPWGKIYWTGQVYASAGEKYGLLLGEDPDKRRYLLKIDWSGGWDKVTDCVYVTNPLPNLGQGAKLLLPGGRFIICGGVTPWGNDNYSPLAETWMLELEPEEVSSEGGSWPLILAILLLVALAASAYIIKRKKHQGVEATVKEEGDKGQYEELFRSIVALMEDEHLYKRKDLKTSDVAAALGTNTRYVSAAINAKGTSFVDFVNGYRIRYAMELLRSQRQPTIADVADESGFTSDVSFFRNFKKVTGLTPTQWLNK